MDSLTRLLKSFTTQHAPPLPPSDPPIQIQLLSDIHLEIASQYTTYSFPHTAPYLLLAGDVGNLVHYADYLAFLKSLTPHYSRVFLLLGNHDFYGLTYEATLDAAARITAEPDLHGKVTLLHRTRWDDPDSDLTILGCTLWSRVPAKAGDTVFYRVSDYLQIKEWTVEKHNEKHLEEVDWLKRELAKLALEHKAAVKKVADENKKRRKEAEANRPKAASPPVQDLPADLPLPRRRRILVATHHAPCVKGAQRPDKEDKPWASAFVTDLVPKGGWSDVDVWAFGHTHFSTEMLVKGTRIVANQRGYDFKGNPDPKDENFDPAYVIKM
ncbi:hypothetical protein jhhlp_000084 [Lomentospora prolificans]|uniref:Calcineurin-like phosphoesterase domain-containing protein n=1 Tax=Lomentospora prolificans TaxID=41688 RepID=A0A2N3NLJ5_9PEZI|nr:hypothetical protein jhhlp_000084 [Lomentospora prolificans]